MKLPSAAFVVKLAVVVTVISVLAIGALVAWLSGSIVAGVVVAVVLLILGVPPIFVAQNLIERAVRQRKAKNFRTRVGHGGTRSFASGDRETMT